MERGSLGTSYHTQGLCHNDGIGKRKWHIAYGPLSWWRPASATRLFWDLVKMFPIDTFFQCCGPGCWWHQHRKGEGLDPLEEMEVGKEKPSTRIWEDRQWDTPLYYLVSCVWLSKMVAASHRWLSSPWNVANATEELNCNSWMWLMHWREQLWSTRP